MMETSGGCLSPLVPSLRRTAVALGRTNGWEVAAAGAVRRGNAEGRDPSSPGLPSRGSGDGPSQTGHAACARKTGETHVGGYVSGSEAARGRKAKRRQRSKRPAQRAASAERPPDDRRQAASLPGAPLGLPPTTEAHHSGDPPRWAQREARERYGQRGPPGRRRNAPRAVTVAAFSASQSLGHLLSVQPSEGRAGGPDGVVAATSPRSAASVSVRENLRSLSAGALCGACHARCRHAPRDAAVPRVGPLRPLRGAGRGPPGGSADASLPGEVSSWGLWVDGRWQTLLTIVGGGKPRPVPALGRRPAAGVPPRRRACRDPPSPGRARAPRARTAS
jgi:hypothetical protein